MKIMGYHF